MSQFVADIRQTIVPGRNARYGPLPPLLVSMTLVTGLVDSFSVYPLAIALVVTMVAAGTGGVLARSGGDWLHEQ